MGRIIESYAADMILRNKTFWIVTLVFFLGINVVVYFVSQAQPKHPDGPFVSIGYPLPFYTQSMVPVALVDNPSGGSGVQMEAQSNFDGAIFAIDEALYFVIAGLFGWLISYMLRKK
jgi:hypothetical protein